MSLFLRVVFWIFILITCLAAVLAASMFYFLEVGGCRDGCPEGVGAAFVLYASLFVGLIALMLGMVLLPVRRKLARAAR